ncbi:MAG: SDR family NAD(P)-dependent oxidoreductase [Gammaproteobacteria bacterium]|nr:MAG: SDR family NAD(P)-dependent oxidoreductase [Gammaproteobacteria bacterium]RLA13678.1 MAG: SDR family NAD(P)-dependent oxidoreductase [Gammaproteobacteria bacterium]
MSKRLQGKVALITGTADGQGRAAALAFAREGARIVGCDLKADLAEETVRMVRDAGGEMVSMQPLDLDDEQALIGWIEFAVAEYGDFDILYNNASGVRGGTIETLTREQWDYNLANEITIVFLAIKHALPVFKRKGEGVIINTGSIAGMIGAAMPANVPGNLVHNVSKGAVLRMTNNLAVELSPHNIRVNAISPGIIDTPATHGLIVTAGDQPWFDSQLIQRIGQSEDIAKAAVFLASDEASFITGINLPVDGGWSASGGAGQPDPEISALFGQAMAELATAPNSKA